MSELPHNPSFENAVIGSILYDNTQYHRVRDLLSPEDFYTPANTVIWQVMTDLLGSGKTADPLMVRETLERNGQLEEAGGPDWLAECYESAAFGPEIGDYGRIVAELAERRALILAGQELAASAKDESAKDALYAHEEALEQIRDRATSQRPISSASDSVEHALFYGEEEDMLKTGYPTLDKELGGFERGAVSVIAAGTGMGKSALNICLMAHIAEHETVGLISLDMSRRVVNQRLACYLAWQGGQRVPTFRQIKDRQISTEQRDMLAQSLTSERGQRIFIDERGGLTTAEINAQIRAWKAQCRRKGLPPLGAVFIDHIGKVYPRQKSSGLYEKISYVSNELLEVAKQHPTVALIELCQLNRDGPRMRRRPRVADLRDSGKIEEDASAIILLHREEWHLEQDAKNEGLSDDERRKAETELMKHRGLMEVIIGKNRNGPTGAVTLRHSIAHNVVRDPSWEKQGKAA